MLVTQTVYSSVYKEEEQRTVDEIQLCQLHVKSWGHPSSDPQLSVD